MLVGAGDPGVSHTRGFRRRESRHSPDVGLRLGREAGQSESLTKLAAPLAGRITRDEFNEFTAGEHLDDNQRRSRDAYRRWRDRMRSEPDLTAAQDFFF